MTLGVALQAAGSWLFETCCAAIGNDCHRNDHSPNGFCDDRTSSSDWLFGLWPGPPQRFEPTGTNNKYQYVDTKYQHAEADYWPVWGGNNDLQIGTRGAPGGSHGGCHQGDTYRGTSGEICGGTHNWGATDVEVWYPLWW